MPFDLLLSENGDLVFSAIRDLAGIAGTGQVNQSIRIRMKIPRATWMYDEDGTLGSQLYTLINTNPVEAQARAEAYVREALRPMDEVQVDHVEIDYEGNDVIVNVYYHLLGVGDDEGAAETGALTLTIPLGG